MVLNVLIVPDKFKGSLTAAEAAAAIARGWRRARPGDQLAALPMSDGGDGFGMVLGDLLGARRRTVASIDAAHRPCQAAWWWDAANRRAIIESSTVVGLAQLPAGKFHPFALDTFGLGRVLRTAAAAGARSCLVGIGGSATNDGGFGVARAMGWHFLDPQGKSIESWTSLHSLAKIRRPRPSRWFADFTVAVDVQNRLLGPKGATRVYGPQKGIQPAEFALAEKNLSRLARVQRLATGHHLARVPGTGAAGGLGFGLALMGARLVPGFGLFARLAALAAKVAAADLVVTGEGSLDASSLMGKGVGEVADLCRRSCVACIALAGTVRLDGRRGPFAFQAGLTDLTTREQALRQPVRWLESLARHAATHWQDRLATLTRPRSHRQLVSSPGNV